MEALNLSLYFLPELLSCLKNIRFYRLTKTKLNITNLSSGLKEF